MAEPPPNVPPPVHGDRVAVLVRRPFSRLYDYRADGPVAEGAYVRVPFGKGGEAAGVVWGPAEGKVAGDRLKTLGAVSDLPPMRPGFRDFLAWVSGYALAPLGSVLRMALPVPEAFLPGKGRTAFAPAPEIPEGARLTPARRGVLAALEEAGGPLESRALAEAAGVSPATVRAMAAAGLIVGEEVGEGGFPLPDPGRAGPELTDAQRKAAAELARAVDARDPRPALLDGVTGSGKTEVYFEAIAAALAQGRQALVLLPEIALGPQWLARFTARFGAPPGRWHSGVPQGERRATWRGVARGEVPVVVGARSALFLPFPDLGVVVVDEEHDTSYKQEEGVVYNARDMAVVRAAKEGAALVLASATPSLESHVNADEGRYRRLVLPARYGGAEFPEVRAVDLRKDPPGRGMWLSPPLVEEAQAALERNEQVLFFLNRRGYAPVTVCQTCGWHFGCSACSAWLVDHRHRGRLLCHHCGHHTEPPEACPSCGSTEALAACGPGVERVAEEVRKVFPGIEPTIMTSDTVTGAADVARIVEGMEGGAIRVLIGTQMAAKGHHFPDLTLVGVVDADLGLGGADLRAGERTYQLLTQVAGRAGRAERKGRVLLQTWDTDHPVMAAFLARDRDAFLRVEAEGRSEAEMPPFGRLVAVVLSGRDPDEVEGTARKLARAAPAEEGVELLGPAPAPLARIRERYRFRMLLRSRRGRPLQAYVRAWLAGFRAPYGVNVKVDVDPYSFL